MSTTRCLKITMCEQSKAGECMTNVQKNGWNVTRVRNQLPQILHVSDFVVVVVVFVWSCPKVSYFPDQGSDHPTYTLCIESVDSYLLDHLRSPRYYRFTWEFDILTYENRLCTDRVHSFIVSLEWFQPWTIYQEAKSMHCLYVAHILYW